MENNNFNNADQRTLDWHRKRLGFFTGSSCGKLMVKGRGKDVQFGATALSYIYKVAVERKLNPEIVESDFWFQNYIDQNNPTTRQMEWGVSNEPLAREKCEKVYGIKIEEVSSIPHPTIPYFSASPDGYIVGDEERGVVEIKCTGVSNFGNYMFNLKDADSLKAINSDYYYQVMAEMAVTGAKYCLFFVYCPFVVPSYVTIRIERDDEVIAELEERVKLANKFIEENGTED